MDKVEVIHVAGDNKGYEIVEYVAERMSKKTHIPVIKKSDGEYYFTGGLILKKIDVLISMLDQMPKEQHYDFLLQFRQLPYVKPYFEED